MSQRWLHTTKYIWCLLVLNAGPSWNPVQGVSVKSAPKTPSTIEAQAKFFQDFFSVQLSPHNIEFGHVCEDPNTWEQRYEKKDFKNHRDMGKVRWGDKKGGYGEHYWDLNHAGHNNDHDDDDHYNDRSDDGSYHGDEGSYHGDDGSYHGEDDKSNYKESNDHSPIYGTEEYDPEKASYEDTGRIKRAHPRVKQEKRTHKEVYEDEESDTPKPKSRKVKEQYKEAPTYKEERYSTEDNNEEEEDEEPYKKPRRFQQKHTHEEESGNPQPKEQKEKNQFVLVVKEKDRKPQEQNPYPSNGEHSQQVPYEGGAGVRQHRQPEVTAAASVPRLFLEPSTGHVVDRATGQAYVLQPIALANNNYYN